MLTTCIGWPALRAQSVAARSVLTPAVEPAPEAAAGSVPVEVVLLVDDVTEDLDRAFADLAFAFLQMPLNHLGMRLVEHPLTGAEPADLDPARVRAVGTWFSSEVELPGWCWPWLERQDPSLRVLHLGSLQPLARADGGRRLTRHLRRFGLGFDAGVTVDQSRISVSYPEPALYPFESQPVYERAHLGPWNLDSRNTPWVLTHDSAAPDRPRAPVVTGPWGGIGLHPWLLRIGGLDHDRRWYADPFRFCRMALGLDGVPAPDPSMRTGRRMFVLHVDGDGFESESTVADGAICGEVFRDRIVDRWRIPMTIGFIVASLTDRFEPARPTARMELARSIAARPWVELASHSVLHPMDWRGALGPRALRRSVIWYGELDGYRHDMVAEVTGSIGFLDRWIAPPGRRCRVMLWSGKANPTPEVLAAAAAAGCQNLNGGLFRCDPLYDSIGFVTPWGRRVGDQWQTFAAAPNENWYPGFFTTVPAAFGHVTTTIERTGGERILKPANVYVHFYSAEQPVRLAALERLLERWVDREETIPVPASTYAAAVHDAQFECATVRTGQGFRFTGYTHCRTARIDGCHAAVDWRRSSGLLGARRIGDRLYLHLSSPTAEVVLGETAAPWLHVEQADCPLDDVVTGERQLRLRAGGYRDRLIVVAGAPPGAELRCRTASGRSWQVGCDGGGRATLRIGAGPPEEVRVWLP